MKLIPAKARYNYVFSTLARVYEEYDPHIFPIVNPFDFIELQSYWEVHTYNEVKSSDFDPVTFFKSKDAKLYWDKKTKYIIFYNTDRIKRRINFSIAHEIGHILLGHLEEFEKTSIERGGLTSSEYRVLETEADVFASNFLSPIPFIRKLKWSSNDVFSICNLTKDASAVRLRTLKSDLNRMNDTNRLNMFLNLSEAIISLMGKLKCFHCGHIYNPADSSYCEICGSSLEKKQISKRIQGEEIFSMKYDGIEMTDEGYCVECVTCKNEEINSGEEYCKICGTIIKNRCPNLDCKAALLPGNARHCPYCGAKSTFLLNGLLKPWDEVTPTPKIRKPIAALAPVDDIDPDEIPF
jgi:hypothetical protein